MIIVAKQMVNSMFMYVYLLYYTERIRRDKRFMLKEAANQLKADYNRTMLKIKSYEQEHPWKQ